MKNKQILTLIVMAAFLIISSMFIGNNRNTASIKDESSNNFRQQDEKTMAVVVKTKELDLIDLKSNSVTILDSGGMFSRPVISLDKHNIAYLKDSALFVTNLQGEKTKVADNAPLSYTWFDKNHLLYSPESEGIFIYDTEKKESQPYIKNEFSYENITLGAAQNIYAEKYRYYQKDSNKFIQDYGIVLFPSDTTAEHLVIHSIPSNDQQNSLGMYPVIAGISKDCRFLYIFEHPHAGSLAADGLSLASYDTKSNQYLKCSNQQIVTLRYNDNISSNPENSKDIAIIKGSGREMNVNKTLGILNVVTGAFERLLPEGQAAMTPYYSEDGQDILYAASKEITGVQNMSQWLKAGHYIYKINIETKQITQLTNSLNGFDFAPIYINAHDIVFLRMDSEENAAMWELKNGQETKLVDGLIFYNDQYKTQGYYGHLNNSAYLDIK